MEYFVGAKPENIILDQLQSEQGARFMRKRNRNYYKSRRGCSSSRRLSLDDSWTNKKLMHYDNVVNMDTRTVLSGLKISDYVTPLDAHRGISQFGKDMILSSETNHSYITTREHLSWLSSLKAKYDLIVNFCPVTDMPRWKKTATEIVRDDEKYFKIIGVNVTISNREVASWCQPLVEPMQQGLCAFIIKKINGVYHFLVQAKLKCGNFERDGACSNYSVFDRKYSK